MRTSYPHPHIANCLIARLIMWIRRKSTHVCTCAEDLSLFNRTLWFPFRISGFFLKKKLHAVLVVSISFPTFLCMCSIIGFIWQFYGRVNRFSSCKRDCCSIIVLRKTGVKLWSTDLSDRLCGLVVRVPGYRSRGQVSIPGATRLPWK
jgi:hypothetical protein